MIKDTIVASLRICSSCVCVQHHYGVFAQLTLTIRHEQSQQCSGWSASAYCANMFKHRPPMPRTQASTVQTHWHWIQPCLGQSALAASSPLARWLAKSKFASRVELKIVLWSRDIVIGMASTSPSRRVPVRAESYRAGERVCTLLRLPQSQAYSIINMQSTYATIGDH